MRTQAIVSVMWCLCGVACASSQAEQVRDARMEQIDAQTVARTRLIEDRQEAREEAIERSYDSAKTDVDHQKRPDKEAAKDMLDLSEQRALYQSKAVARMETIRVRIDAARSKLATVPPTKHENLRRELAGVEREFQERDQQVQSFPNAPAANWEDDMEALDDRITDLNTRVKAVTDAIEAAQ